MPRRVAFILLLLAAALAAAIAARLLIGGGLTHQLLELRAVRTLVAATAGAALAVAGVMLQSLLRNPLASPDLMGMSSGAGLGAMLAVFFAYKTGLGISDFNAVTLPALAGSFAVLGLILWLSRRRGSLDPVLLVLIGVVVSLLCGAATDLIRSFMPDRGDAAARVLVGAVRDEVSKSTLALVAAATLIAIAVGVRIGPALDAASLGDDEARSVGVDLGKIRTITVLIAATLAAGSVLIVGAVGFVGLIAPHAARLIVGPTHRWLVLAAALIGAPLVIAADAVIRIADFGSGRLPLSVVMTAIGAPVFVWMLLRLRERWA